MKNKRKHKHKKKLSEKKKARQEIKRLRRAERRSGLLQESQNDEDNVLSHSSVTHQMTASDENRIVRRQKHKSHQKKARDLMISRLRQIVLSDASGDEDGSAVSSPPPPSIPVREEPKIPSAVSRSLRKQVNKLSQVFDSSLKFNADPQETENADS